MKFLITGGTVFASKFAATYFVKKGHEVFVLNRGTKPQVNGVKLIMSDRNSLNHSLDGMYFDAVIDICAYNKTDIGNLLNADFEFDKYIFISSSAVYPETLPQPFNENQAVGRNSIWGDYSINKIEAEKLLLSKFPSAYIIRPSYLYGPMQNLYREPFVFECAELNRRYFIPDNGDMKLQFFHIEDLCRLIEKIINDNPINHIYNAGNNNLITVNAFVDMCYQIVGKCAEKIHVKNYPNERDYFCFYNYEFSLDISLLNEFMPNQKDLYCGLKESYEWYKRNKDEVNKKPYIAFINKNF